MKCPFCGFDFPGPGAAYDSENGKLPAFCSQCRAGHGGLTSGQIEIIGEEIHSANRESWMAAIFIGLLLAIGALAVRFEWAVWEIAVPFALSALCLGYGAWRTNDARNLHWLLAHWGKEKR